MGLIKDLKKLKIFRKSDEDLAYEEAFNKKSIELAKKKGAEDAIKKYKETK